MAEITKIEWTGTWYDEPVMWRGNLTNFIPGATFNLVIGCAKVSPACKFCYAEALDHRWKGDHWGPNANRKQMSDNYWKQPLKWDKEAAAAGVRRKVFCSSMADWCEDHPQLTLPRQKLFALIEATPNLDWLLLTKRPENILRFIPDEWKRIIRPNVWYGTTIESQDYAWRIDELCKVPAMLRFISSEPLMSNLELTKYLGGGFRLWSDRMAIAGQGKIHWVITGGESGYMHQARPTHPDWYRNIRRQCKIANVPFFFKQWGNWFPVDPWDDDSIYKPSQLKYFTELDCRFAYMHKTDSGHLLDNKVYHEMPNFKKLTLK